MLKIRLHNRQRLFPVSKRRVDKLLRLAAPSEWSDAELSVAVVESEQMTDLNRKYTGRETDTDVLAFPLDDETVPDGGDHLVGEIVISASRTVAEAQARGLDPQDELALYLIHGALHLQGYGDHSAADSRRMYAREREILRKAGIGDVRAS